MAVVLTFAQSIDSTSNNVSSYTSAAFTPAAGDVLYLAEEISLTTGLTSITDSLGGSWSKTEGVAISGLTDHSLNVWVRNSTVSATSMTVTVNTSVADGTGCSAHIYRASGVNGSGTASIVQDDSGTASSGTPETVFASSAVTTNATLVFAVTSANPAGLTPPTNWTEGADTGHATPTRGMESAVRNSGFTGTTITWGSTGVNWGAISIEILAASVATPSSVLAPVLAVNNPIPPTLIGSQCDKNSGTQTLSCTASVSALVKVVLFVTHDPGITVTSITDTRGNLYVSDGSITNGSGTSGVTTTCYAANLAFPLVSGTDSITANFSASRGAACMAAIGVNLNFSVDEGNNTHQATGTAPSTTITPVGNPSMGFVCCGVEGPDTDVYTEDADWTAVLNTGTTGGADASNVSLNMAFLLIGTAAATPYTPTLGTSRPFAQYEVVYSYADADPATGTSYRRLPLMGCGP